MADQLNLEAEQNYKLVKAASDDYRRAATRRDRARVALRKAEEAFEIADRGLKLAIRGIQPPLVPEAAGGDVLEPSTPPGLGAGVMVDDPDKRAVEL